MNTKEEIYQIILDKHKESGSMCGISFVGIVEITETSYKDRNILKELITDLLNENKIYKREGINNTLYFIKEL